VGLGDVLDAHSVLGRQRLRRRPNPVAQRLGKACLVKEANRSGVESRVAGSPCDDPAP
jgi:hypothetical protein